MKLSQHLIAHHNVSWIFETVRTTPQFITNVHFIVEYCRVYPTVQSLGSRAAGVIAIAAEELKCISLRLYRKRGE